MTDISVQHRTVFLGLILVIGVSLTISSCSKLSETDSKRIQEALSDSLISSTETWGLQMDLIENTRRKVRIEGSYAASYKTDEQTETRINGPVKIQVYDSLDTVQILVTSNRAVYKPDDSIFELYGDVNVTTRDKKKLESEYLEWDRISNNLSTPKFVIVKTPTDSIAGTGFTGTTDLTSYTIDNPTGRVIFD